MPTLISSTIKPIREILGENLSCQFDDSVIEMAAKTTIRFGKPPSLSLSQDQKAINQDIATESKEMRLWALHSAKMLVGPKLTSKEVKNRKFEIENEIYELENYD